nr:cell division cycle 5-like protein [Tanacetum cinerariifolium]
MRETKSESTSTSGEATTDGFDLSTGLVADNDHFESGVGGEAVRVRNLMSPVETTRIYMIKGAVTISQKKMRAVKLRSHVETTFKRMDTSGTEYECLQALERQDMLLLAFRLGPNLCILFIMGSITDIKFVLTQKALMIFCETYHIPDEVHPQLPSPNQTIHEMPSGKIGVYTSKGVPKDPFPKYFEFKAEHVATLVALLAPFHKYPEPFLCLVGISRYYTLDEDAYPEFLGDNDEEMDLLSFIRTANPKKVRVAESDLEASVDKLFDEGASGDGQGADIQPLVATTDTIVEDVAPEAYGALGGASTAGKSRSAVQSLFTEVVLNVEARGKPILTLPFVTSSVSATPEHEEKSPADSVTGLNLRTVGAPQRFVISLDFSHHSGANITEAEVDSIVRSSAPAIATVTTVTVAVDADATADRVPVAPSLFGVGSSSTGRTDSVPGGFFDVSGSDFRIGGIRTVVDPDSDLQKVYVPQWSISLSAEVRMRVEYNIREKRKLRTIVDEQAELLKVRDGEIESLKAQLLLKEAEATEAIRLRAKVREHEVADLDAQVTAIKLHNDNLVDQVHELEISSAGLQEKVAAYEDFIGQLKKFQDKKIEEVNEKFDKLSAEKGMQEGLSAGITHGTEGRKLADVATYNPSADTDYQSALQRLQNGPQLAKPLRRLSAGITHGAEGRKLADVATYNPSADTDYQSALQRLQNVNFSLIAELKSNKDASVDTIMNLLHLDDALAERLGLTKSQPHANQLMKRENIASHVSDLHGIFVPLSEPLSVVDLEGPEGGAGVDDETAAVGNINLFSDVSNAELNILE